MIVGLNRYLSEEQPSIETLVVDEAESGEGAPSSGAPSSGSETPDGSHDPIELFCGLCDRVPTVDMSMSSDTAHQFWLGKVNLVAALTRGTMTAKGPIPAIMKLLPAITPAYKRYPEILREKGLESLIDA